MNYCCAAGTCELCRDTGRGPLITSMFIPPVDAGPVLKEMQVVAPCPVCSSGPMWERIVVTVDPVMFERDRPRFACMHRGQTSKVIWHESMHHNVPHMRQLARASGTSRAALKSCVEALCIEVMQLRRALAGAGESMRVHAAIGADEQSMAVKQADNVVAMAAGIGEP